MAVVDDDDEVRRVVVKLMESVGLSTGSFSSAHELLNSLDAVDASVLVVDLILPDMTGLVLQDQLRAQGCDLPIVFISGHADLSTAVRAMRKGAFDFVEKPFKPLRLFEAVQRAFDESVRIREWNEKVRDARQRISRLTDRQLDVLEGMVAGKANKVIASDLGLSQRTVEVHRADLMRRLNVDSLASAVQTYLFSAHPVTGDLPRSKQRPPSRSVSAG